MGHGPAAVFDDIDIVAFAQTLNCRPRDAHFSPKTSKHDVFAPCCLDGFLKAFIVPRIHGSAFYYSLARKYIEELRPYIAAEGFRLHSRDHSWHMKFLCHFGKE